MLKYEKARAKLVEFSVPADKYPNFPLDSTDLILTTIYALSKYSERYISAGYKGEIVDNTDLRVVSQYYDNLTRSDDHEVYSDTYLLLGSIAYFCLENFGSAKVLISKICPEKLDSTLEKTLFCVLDLLLNNTYSNQQVFENYSPYQIEFIQALTAHFKNGDYFSEVENKLQLLYQATLSSNDPYEVTYVDFLFPIIVLAKEYSAWNILPLYSQSTKNSWEAYLVLPYSIHLLWPAQKAIIEKNTLTGANAVIPLPTGVGKTKSFELLIYSRLYIQGKKNIVIIAPLRALCNEISSDIKKAFRGFEDLDVTKFTDVYQEDSYFNNDKRNVIISTPEKLMYVMRHEPQFIDQIDLFIFDEAHLFDDESRGITYELLITDISRLKTADCQTIFFSAILSNSEEISDWLFHNSIGNINTIRIESTEKTIGYLSGRQQIHYYETEVDTEETFFIPSIIEQTNLNTGNRKAKKWYFPVMNDKTDLSIFYSNRLVKNGACAIFVGIPASILKIISRVIEIDERNFDFNNLSSSTNHEESSKLKNLFELHYGQEHLFTKGCDVGVFPHYADLVAGIRESVEYAIKKDKIKLVVCTSTLAEGVNIPIRYLMIYSLSQGQKKLTNRTITNLIGRIARSGFYTDGSVLILDNDFYDNRLTYSKGGIYRWNELRNSLSSNNNERCESTLLHLVSDYNLTYKSIIKYKGIFELFKQFYPISSKWKIIISKRCYFEFKEEPSLKVEIDKYLSVIYNIIESLESYFSFIYSEMEQKNIFFNESIDIIEKTFGFYLANSEQKETLREIMTLILTKATSTLNNNNSYYYSKSLYGFDISTMILEWMEINYDNISSLDELSILKELINLYYSILVDEPQVDQSEFFDICEAWMAGLTFLEIGYLFREDKIQKIEKLLSKEVSYKFTYFIGTVIDALEDEEVIIISKLQVLQKKLKNGVGSLFEIVFCESIINDRLVSKNVYQDIFDKLNISERIFPNMISLRAKEVRDYLSMCPTYYNVRFDFYLSSL